MPGDIFPVTSGKQAPLHGVDRGQGPHSTPVAHSVNHSAPRSTVWSGEYHPTLACTLGLRDANKAACSGNAGKWPRQGQVTP